MTISVASRLYRPSGLSELGRLVVAFIDGGRQWLDWAMLDPQARYAFPDEGSLVAAVQTGLHGSPYVLLPRTGLLVSPIKLMAMNLPDLRLLARAEGGTTTPSAEDLADVLTRHSLATQRDLAAGPAFLAQLGIADAPHFQAMALDDALALLDFARGAPGDAAIGLQREAAAFGIAQGRTAREVIDYFRTYLAIAQANAPIARTPAQRTAAAQAALDTLLPLAFGMLDCPSVDGLVAPWEVAAAVAEWLLMGRQMGFARLSLAVQQLIANGGYTGQTGPAAQAMVRDYLARAQVLLNSTEIGSGTLGQDGRSARFALRSDLDDATVELGPTGTITLATFGRRPPAANRTPKETLP